MCISTPTRKYSARTRYSNNLRHTGHSYQGVDVILEEFFFELLLQGHADLLFRHFLLPGLWFSQSFAKLQQAVNNS